MQIGIIGAGNIGQAVAKLAISASSLANSWRFARAKPAYCVPLDEDGLREAVAAEERDVELAHASRRSQPKKSLYIVPGYGAVATDHWFPWLEDTAQQAGFKTRTISFPDSEYPNLNNWLNYLDDVISQVDENTYFVAHSLGCVTILRYLQERKHPAKIGGCILVSGFSNSIPEVTSIPAFADLTLAEVKALAEFTDFVPDFSYLSQITENRVVVASADDYVLPPKYRLSETLAESLKSDFHLIAEGGHFLGDDGFTEFPLIADLLQTMSLNE